MCQEGQNLQGVHVPIFFLILFRLHLPASGSASGAEAHNHGLLVCGNGLCESIYSLAFAFDCLNNCQDKEYVFPGVMVVLR